MGTCVRVGATLALALLAVPALAGQGQGQGPTFTIGATRAKIGESQHAMNGGNRVVVRDGSVLYAVWVTHGQGSDHTQDLRFAKSLDGGDTWGASTLVARGHLVNEGMAVALGPDPAGGRRVHVLWGDYDTDSQRYTHSGRWFTDPITIGSNFDAWSGSLAADEQGGVHVLTNVQQADGTYQATYFVNTAHGDGDGFSFQGSPLPVAPGQDWTALHADAAGNLFAAVKPDRLYFLRKPAGEAWSTPEVVAETTGGSICSLAIDPGPNRAYVAFEGGSGPNVAASTIGTGAWITVSVLPGTAEQAWDTSIAVDEASGDVSLAWRSGGAVRFARSTDAGRTWGSLATPFEQGHMSTSLVLDAAGKAIVAAEVDDVLWVTREK